LSKPRNPLKRLEEGKNALSAASIISALAKNQNDPGDFNRLLRYGDRLLDPGYHPLMV
jgi:hypothetical protein